MSDDYQIVTVVSSARRANLFAALLKKVERLEHLPGSCGFKNMVRWIVVCNSTDRDARSILQYACSESRFNMAYVELSMHTERIGLAYNAGWLYAHPRTPYIIKMDDDCSLCGAGLDHEIRQMDIGMLSGPLFVAPRSYRDCGIRLDYGEAKGACIIRRSGDNLGFWGETAARGIDSDLWMRAHHCPYASPKWASDTWYLLHDGPTEGEAAKRFRERIPPDTKPILAFHGTILHDEAVHRALIRQAIA